MMLSKRYIDDGISTLELNKVQISQKKRIQNHIKSGFYKFETIPCLICSSTKFKTISKKDRYGIKSPTAICLDCGFIQSNPRMTNTSYIHFYNDGHRRLYVGTETPSDTYFEQRLQVGYDTAEYLSSFVDIKDKKILEVGCGSGAILHILKKQGASVKGIDLSDEYLNYGKKRYDIDISNTDLFNLPDNDEYDIIIYSDVLEHILDPSQHLQKIHKLLHKDGFLYIKVPGIQNLLIPYLNDFLRSIQNAHVSYFCLTTLKNLLHKNGYKLFQGDESIRSIWKKSNSNKFNIQNAYLPTMQFLKKTEKQTLIRIFLTQFYLGKKLYKKLWKIKKKLICIRFSYS